MLIFLLKSWKQQWLTLYFLWGFFQKILCLVESVIQQKSHSLIQHQISQLTLSLINHQAKKFLADFFFLTREITAVCSWIQIYWNLKWSFDADQFLSTHTAQWAIFQEILGYDSNLVIWEQDLYSLVALYSQDIQTVKFQLWHFI